MLITEKLKQEIFRFHKLKKENSSLVSFNNIENFFISCKIIEINKIQIIQKFFKKF